MELAAFVALRSALGIFSLAGAELTKILGGLGSDVCEELHFDAAKGLPCWESKYAMEDVEMETQRATSSWTE